MTDLLTVRKSIKLLTKMVAYGAMILWVLLLSLILSTPAKAQDLSEKRIIEYVDFNCYKVYLENGGYYHVNSNGIPCGRFKSVSIADDVKIVAIGEMMNGKRVGTVIYTMNGKKIMTRTYNSEGVLIRSTRFRVSSEAIS